MKKENIFFITYSITEKGTPYERLRYLTKHFNVYVFCHTSIISELVPLCKAVYTCPGRFVRFDLLLFPFWVAFKSLFKKPHPIIFTTFNNTALVAGYFMKLLGFRWVADIFDDPVKYAESLKQEPWSIRKLFSLVYFWLTYFIIKIGLKKADFVICSMVEDVLNKYNVLQYKIFSTMNGVDLAKTEKILNDLKRREKVPAPFKIVYVGDMSPSRPMDLILDGITGLSRTIGNFLVYFIGDAPYSFREMVKKSTVNNKITFLGHMDQKNVYKIISECHVGLCLLRNTSDYPFTYPLKIFEYMALECVVLATELPGIKRIIKNGVNGVLIPPEDPDSLWEALLELYENPLLCQRLSNAGRESIKKYDWEIINHRILLGMKGAL